MTSGISSLALSIAMATAAGLVGCFALMRRMTLASDALAHVALPGIGVAIAFHLHPVLGGLAALFLGTLMIWGLEHRTRLSTETIIGVVFSSALAIGSLLASGEDLIDALLGSPGSLTVLEIVLGMAGAAMVIAFVLTQRNRLVVSLVSPDLARTAGVNVARLDLFYLLAFAVTVALGLRYLGVLLMGSLVIIPAASAKHLARSLAGMFAIAVAVAVASTVAGSLLATRFQRPSGPVIISFAAVFFFLALVRRRRA
jgi:ABC-type Mn2+/Zn2+ transport system permease subunit